MLIVKEEKDKRLACLMCEYDLDRVDFVDRTVEHFRGRKIEHETVTDVVLTLYCRKCDSYAVLPVDASRLEEYGGEKYIALDIYRHG